VAELVRTYNDTFNSYVLRSYDNAQLSLPGMATTFQPRPHQLAAVARIINEPGVGLYHAVGAGKTAVMIMGAMELRRLGLVSKPVIVVPNNLLAQFAREFQQLYPRAKVLAATKDDLKADRRRALVGRIATGDWDAVIMTESSFLRLPMSPQVQRDYINQQVADLRKQIVFAGAHGKPMTLKRLEAALARREEKLEAKLDGVKDDGVWFEVTGIDYIFRDESDRDKNLHAASNMEGMSIDGSQRASEMDMKLAYLRSRHARWGTRATGTPVANSMIELYTEFRYLRPRLLNQLGITDLDSYLATFAQPVTGIEVTPDGGGLRSRTRVAKFVNVPELLTHLHVLADVKTPDDLDLPRPQLAPRPDGQREPEMIVVQPSDELLDKVAELVQRAEKIRGRRPEAGDDNMLNITHEGRSAALDLRLVGMTTEAPQKLHVAADRIAGIWSETADRVYLDQHGQPHPTPGALQLVFCDLGTPGKNKPWNAYDELRDQLTARGVPRDRIRFIHEAKDDKAKWELFQAARDGRINVLIGSTERMGAGTNVQDRAIALHHLDPQWRPRDIEQREGRIWRQGNQNPDIRILRYVTERSFDAYMWQTLERKAKFINQIMRGRYDGREAEDVGDGAMSYEEIKAAATGNPLLVDHAAAKAELARLERLERAHRRNLDRLRWTLSNAHHEIEIGQALIGEIDQAIARRIDTRGKAFTMTIADRQYTKRGEANNRLKTILGLELANPASVNRAARDIGTLGGFTIKARIGRYDGQRFVHLLLADCPRSELSLTEKELAEGADLVTRLENRLTKLETLRDHTEADIARRRDEIQRAGQELNKPFRHTDALAQARTQFQHLDIQVAALAAEGDTEQPATGTTAGSPPQPAPVPAATPSADQPTDRTATPRNGSPDRRAPGFAHGAAVLARPPTVAAPRPGAGAQPVASPDASAAPEVAAERPSARPAAADAPPEASQVEPIRLEINGNSVLAHGTSREDLIARAALKSAGFRWYPSLQAWGLPRNLRPETRHRNISRFRTAMGQSGRDVPVIDQAHPEPSPAATARHSFTPTKAADTAFKPPPTPQKSRNPATLARTAGAAPAPACPRQTATLIEAWSALVAEPPRRPGHARG
jgi:hypothetical protein